jgi:cbb3-type cytochrome oxidase subunit 3
MKQQFLSQIGQSPLLVLPLVAMFLFLLVFAAWVFRTYSRRPEAYAKIAALPLEDDARPVKIETSTEQDHGC